MPGFVQNCPVPSRLLAAYSSAISSRRSLSAPGNLWTTSQARSILCGLCRSDDRVRTHMTTGLTEESSAKNWLPPPKPSWPSWAAFMSARPVHRAPVSVRGVTYHARRGARSLQQTSMPRTNGAQTYQCSRYRQAGGARPACSRLHARCGKSALSWTIHHPSRVSDEQHAH